MTPRPAIGHPDGGKDLADDDPWVRQGRIPSLDGLRSVGIVMVLLEHARASTGFPSLGPFAWFTTHGLLGVEVFFSLSGFLITILLLREFDRTGGVKLGAFYLRRALRIVPAYAALLLAVLVLSRRGLTSPGAPTDIDWLYALTYTTNFNPHLKWELGHLWSLAIEEQFYLVWPPIFALAPRRLRAVLPVGALAFAFCSRCLLITVFRAHSSGIRGWPMCRMDSIAAGCLLAALVWEPKSRAVLHRMTRHPTFPLIAFLILVGSVELRRYYSLWDLTFAYSINAVCITALVWSAVTHPRSPVGRLLNFPAIAFIGTLSYSLYLWQQLFLNGAHPHPWTRFPQNLLFALFTATISYYIVERPFLNLKDRLGAKRHGRVESATALLAAPEISK